MLFMSIFFPCSLVQIGSVCCELVLCCREFSPTLTDFPTVEWVKERKARR